jgi:predicted Zn-ribbon and HTH transcriptional regulator
LAEQSQFIVDQRPVIIKTYRGSQAEAAKRFQANSAEMAAHGYFPTSQSWAPGQWAVGAFVVAVLLIFLFGLGILILGYMLIVKPDGTLTVTYERRAASVEEKTCPRCAERIKAAALVCHFCGYEFAPPQEVKKLEGS